MSKSCVSTNIHKPPAHGNFVMNMGKCKNLKLNVGQRTLATLIKRTEGQIAIHSVTEHGSGQNTYFFIS